MHGMPRFVVVETPAQDLLDGALNTAHGLARWARDEAHRRFIEVLDAQNGTHAASIVAARVERVPWSVRWLLLAGVVLQLCRWVATRVVARRLVRQHLASLIKHDKRD